MKEKSGRAAVWDHAAETGMQETIRRIAAVFPIEDISIYSPGKLTWLRERPRKYQRIRPFESDFYIDLATGELLKKQRASHNEIPRPKVNHEQTPSGEN